MCLCFTSKHPALLIWKGRKGPGCVRVYLSSGCVYMGAGKGIAPTVPISFAGHINCVSLRVCWCVWLFGKQRKSLGHTHGNSSGHIHQAGIGRASWVREST